MNKAMKVSSRAWLESVVVMVDKELTAAAKGEGVFDEYFLEFAPRILRELALVLQNKKATTEEISFAKASIAMLRPKFDVVFAVAEAWDLKKGMASSEEVPYARIAPVAVAYTPVLDSEAQ